MSSDLPLRTGQSAVVMMKDGEHSMIRDAWQAKEDRQENQHSSRKCGLCIASTHPSSDGM